MAEIGGFDIPIDMPSFAIGTGKVWIGLFILIMCFVGAVVIWAIWTWRTFNRKIIVFENISGQGFQPMFRDKARLIKLGDGGEEILWLKKKKEYKAAYGKKMGKNTYWFAIGQDGYWYNVVLGDVDAKMGMLDIEPIDRDMRYMNVAVRKNIQDRYKSKKMLTATSLVVGGIVLTVIVLFVGNWYMLDKISEVATTIKSAIESAQATQQATRDILVALENVCSGSGVK